MSPSDSIKLLDSATKPKTFCKQVKNADYIVLDISQLTCDFEEAELAIQSLKNASDGPLEQILIVVTSPFVWSSTPQKPDGSSFVDKDFESRIPEPKFQKAKLLEMSALSLTKTNPRLRVHIVCSGFLFGNGEQNDIFYEFFRRAWVSLHPDLAALPVVGKGTNNIPTIHVSDLTKCLGYLITEGHECGNYLFAVDQSKNSSQT